MNRPLHLCRERIVHHPVPLDLTLPFKHGRNDRHPVMPAAGGSAGMTNVQCALVFYLYYSGRESFSQDLLDSFRSIHFFA